MAESRAIAENQSYSKCGGCNEEIRDKYLLQALDKLWHVYCLRCSDCRETLSDDGKCYVRDGNILCDFDFFRRYGKPCTICNEGISPKQSVRKVLDKVYHISCFSCVSCKQQLSTGDLFYLLDDGGIICKPDYDGEQLTKYSGESNPSSPNAESPKSPVRDKSKRVRTFITAQQLSVLKSVYHSSPRPDFAERLRISKETGLDMRVVQVWFQNHRAKERRQSEKGKDPWINILTKTASAAARRRSRSLELTGTPCSPLHEAVHFSDLMCSEDDRGPSKSANSILNVSQQLEDFNQPAAIVANHRPASFTSSTLHNVVIPPLSPAVHDVLSSPGFVFTAAHRPSNFPPVQELLEICEEELRTLTNQETGVYPNQQSPTYSYYADSESDRSNINTPAEERYFVFPDVPGTPDKRRYSSHPSHPTVFPFDPETINGAT